MSARHWSAMPGPDAEKPTSPDMPRELLDAYRQKRSAGRTPEPFGASRAGKRPRLYVIQRHAARRLHYDLRLEHKGVLLSWAVPRGPSLDPAEKRLAVKVEDHPVEYGDFEGVIPEGNYGAGTVILWDQGRWDPVEDPDEAMGKGKLLFELHGYKLRGLWQLVKTKGKDRGPNEWLLIKKPDALASAKDPESFPQESIVSGLTNDDLRSGRRRADEIRAELLRLGAPRRPLDPRKLAPMLAHAAEGPFDDPDYLFELKYDGYRLLTARRGDEPLLSYRRGGNVTANFPEIARAVAALPYEGLVMDGEVVVVDSQGRPSFHGLQRVAQAGARAHADASVVCYAFDLLGFEDFDLRSLPLLSRKDLLRRILPRAGPIRFADHVEERGRDLYEAVRRMGLEGIMAKKARSPYRSGRHEDWLKVKVERTDDFVVVGFTAGKGSRQGFGSLHIAQYESEGGRLRYAGRVGSGFDESELGDVRKQLDALRRDRPTFEGEAVKAAGNAWVEPKLVCEVRYKERTDDGNLRHPVFLRFRDDKEPQECVRQDAASSEEIASSEDEPAAVPDAVEGERETHRVPFSNLRKVFWPAEGYTKGDLIDYYRTIAPHLIPYLRDRPVVMTRYPDGIDGKSFFQKDAPAFAPGWLRTERMWSEHAAREIDYFVCEDVESLLYLANLGTIPLHIWSSRVATLGQPDWGLLDLDPKGAPLSDVARVALHIKDLCDDIGWPAFVKTSGSTGLHVLLPLGGLCTFDQCKAIAELLSRVVVTEIPDFATIQRVIADRQGRVYLDYLQNGHGKLVAAPFSVRPLPGAPVSTPLRWSEVGPSLAMSDYTIRTAPERFERMEDPLLPVLKTRPDLERVLDLLGERLRRAEGRHSGS